MIDKAFIGSEFTLAPRTAGITIYNNEVLEFETPDAFIDAVLSTPEYKSNGAYILPIYCNTKEFEDYM